MRLSERNGNRMKFFNKYRTIAKLHINLNSAPVCQLMARWIKALDTYPWNCVWTCQGKNIPEPGRMPCKCRQSAERCPI